VILGVKLRSAGGKRGAAVADVGTDGTGLPDICEIAALGHQLALYLIDIRIAESVHAGHGQVLQPAAGGDPNMLRHGLGFVGVPRVRVCVRRAAEILSVGHVVESGHAQGVGLGNKLNVLAGKAHADHMYLGTRGGLQHQIFGGGGIEGVVAFEYPEIPGLAAFFYVVRHLSVGLGGYVAGGLLGDFQNSAAKKLACGGVIIIRKLGGDNVFYVLHVDAGDYVGDLAYDLRCRRILKVTLEKVLNGVCHAAGSVGSAGTHHGRKGADRQKTEHQHQRKCRAQQFDIPFHPIFPLKKIS